MEEKNALSLTPVEISREISNIGEKKARATLFELLIFGMLAGKSTLPLALMR